ncbi:MAG: hypothetical protein J6125_01280, partial [Clostridia bacterium]|nr:hypothetical protein [Clostridia bacterium]
MKKQTKRLIILASLAVLTLTVWLILRPHLKGGGDTPAPVTPIALEEGEDYFRLGGTEIPSIGVVYPVIARGDVMQVVVHPKEGDEYLFWHDLREGVDVFYLGQYTDGGYDAGGQPSFYLPQAARESAGFDYSTLYDATGRLPAMLSAVGSIIFGDRVYRWTDDTPTAEVEQNLRRFGLSEADDAPWFEVVPFLCDRLGYHVMTETGDENDLWYLNPSNGMYYHHSGVTWDGSAYAYDVTAIYTKSSSLLRPVADVTSARRVQVGRATPDAGGYYLCLDGRNTVYTTASVATTAGDVDLSNLVHRSLAWYVEPRLLTDAVSLYDPYFTPCFSFGQGVERAEGDPVGAQDTIFVRYGADGAALILSASDGPLFARLIGARVGDGGYMTVGEVARRQRPAEEGDVVSYTPGEILWIYDPAAGAEAAGPATADCVVCLRVRTPSTGEDDEGQPLWEEAVIDLSDPSVPAAVRDALVGRAAGETPAGPWDVLYHVPDDATPVTYEITRVVSVLRGGAETDEPAEAGDLVLFSFRLSVDGRLISADTVALVPDPASPDSEIAALSRALVGQSAGQKDGLAVTLWLVDDPILGEAEVLRDVTVDYAVAYGETLTVSHYAFAGDGQRDAFFGEAIHVITGPADMTPYTVNDASITQMLQIMASFSGLSIPSSSLGGVDPTALETVAVAPDGTLTGEMMRTYGLGARTLVYVLPSGVSETASGQYRYTSARTFHLYIGETGADGYCYVASDAFGVVIRADARIFAPLDLEPLENWTRANLIQTAVGGIASVTFDLAYTDDTATHTFWLSVDDAYPTAGGTVSRLYVAYAEGEPHTEERADGNIRPGPGVAVRDGRVILLEGGVDLDEIYRQAGHTGQSGPDGEGVTHFRKMAASFYSMYYQGTVSDTLDAAAVAALAGDPDAATLTVSVVLTDGRTFAYSFCPYSARRSLCVIRAYDKDGAPLYETAHFYVHTSEVEKLAVMAGMLARGETFDED